LFILDHQSGQLKFADGVVLEGSAEVLPAVGRVTDAELLGDFTADAAPFQVADGFFGMLQLFVVILGGLGHDLGQGGQLRPVVRAFSVTALVFRNLHADALRQFLDGIDEAEPGILHEKADRRPVRAAAEAVVELLARADREGG
jgi:hypothetical protein